MKKKKVCGWTAILFLLVCLPASQARADGGYFSSSRSVAVSADQRAIIIKNGSEISMTFSTGYTGEGGDFTWIIPTPVHPAVDYVPTLQSRIFLRYAMEDAECRQLPNFSHSIYSQEVAIALSYGINSNRLQKEV